MKLLGIDYGTKKAGIAYGFTETQIVLPLKTVHFKSEKVLLNTIGLLLREYEIERIVLGYPLYADGKKNPISTRVKAFCNRLQTLYGVEVVLEKEVYSSMEAGQLRKEMRQQGVKGDIETDCLAAMIILRSYLKKN